MITITPIGSQCDTKKNLSLKNLIKYRLDFVFKIIRKNTDLVNNISYVYKTEKKKKSKQ